MIHGESYKPIVAEAARKAATEVYNRIMVTHLLMDTTKANRVGGAVGFNVRTGDYYVFRAKAVIIAAGGASHIFKPRAVGEGMGRTWYAPWSSASAYGLPIQVGAKMTQMENRIVLTRFKDGYGPVGAYFLHLKTYTQNGYGEEYESKWTEHTRALVGEYVDHHPVPTCLRNHAFLEEMKAGRGPIRMVTKEAFQDPHKETVGWENFLGMTIGQAVVWASQNIDPKHINPELTTSEPYVMGSHATCSGAWASGPEDLAPAEYQWGYNRMMTVDGLFGAGDTIGGSAHKFSSGSFAEGRIAGKAAVRYVNDMGKAQPQVSEQEYQDLEKSIFQPMENFRVGRNEIVAGTVSPSYLLPIHGLQRLQKIMDEYVGGISALYMTNGQMLNRGLELLAMLKEDMSRMGAEDLHQLQRVWELHHRLLAAESVTHHTLFREETRWPGYYYRGDHMKLDDKNWHCLSFPVKAGIPRVVRHGEDEDVCLPQNLRRQFCSTTLRSSLESQASHRGRPEMLAVQDVVDYRQYDIDRRDFHPICSTINCAAKRTTRIPSHRLSFRFTSTATAKDRLRRCKIQFVILKRIELEILDRTAGDGIDQGIVPTNSVH